MMSYKPPYINPTACCDPAEGDQLLRLCTVTIEKEIKNMADWDDIINNRLTMGRSRPLIYALNADSEKKREW